MLNSDEVFYVFEATQTMFRDAIEAIDADLGAGYARKNPHLVAAFMQTYATVYQCASKTLKEGA